MHGRRCARGGRVCGGGSRAASGVRVSEAEALIGRWREARWCSSARISPCSPRGGAAVETGCNVLADASASPAALSASVPLGAATIVLPEGGAWLADVLADVRGRRSARRDRRAGRLRRRRRVDLAVGLACAGTSVGATSLVDLDPLGGGVDLLLGAERAGLALGQASAARGQIGELRREVPEVAGVTLVSMGRDGTTALTRDAVAAVLASLSRSSDLVVMDVGRSLDAGAREALRASDRTVVVCAQDVRGVAAARMTLDPPRRRQLRESWCGCAAGVRSGQRSRDGARAAPAGARSRTTAPWRLLRSGACRPTRRRVVAG